MTRKILSALLVFCFAVSAFSFAQSDEKLLLEKLKLLVQKGQKAEEKGEIDVAVSCYEEAHEIYPKNFLPLLMWGRALYRVGMYARAEEVLKKIPLENLPDNGKSEVHLLLGRIAVADQKLEAAAVAFSHSIKIPGGNIKALLRLAMVNQILKMTSRAEELLAEHDDFSDLPMKELILATLLDFQHGNLGRAYSSISGMEKHIVDSAYPDEKVPALAFLWKIPVISFFGLLPIALHPVYSAIYFAVIFLALVFVAGRLSPQTALWHDLAFIILPTALLVGTQQFSLNDLMLASLSDNFALVNSVWIMPRLLISGHFIALGMFLIFPVFRFLPEEQRPRRFEYYGIWFFCWFFMIFVLSYQSFLSLGVRLGLMAGSALLAFISSFYMPLGRFILYKITNLLGMGSFAEVSRKDLKNKSGISFTDAKILESKSVKLLEKEDWDEVVMTARKVLSALDKKTFPQLWKSMILALIAREDYIDAQKSINEFLEIFSGSALREQGELLDAYLKSCKADYAGALKIIRGFAEDRIKSFSPDEDALSLLVLGRCGLAYKENVQAHIDLNKAFACARLPFIKAESLIEILELDFNMRSRDSVQKWKERIGEIKGGKKSAGLAKTMYSIAAMAEGDSESALNLAREACRPDVRNGRCFAWLGHLLCMSGRGSEAEELLARMTPDSADANRLMTEVTGA